MPFSFLNPWFWLGALALAAPIWLHLRRRQPTNLKEFSTLRFLDDQPQPRQSPLRLRDILLFALRALALLLIVGAFAWPFLKGPGTAPIRESRVYVLDNTLSHQANNGFENQRQRVLQDLAEAGMDTQVAVVELASSPKVLVAFGDDRQAAKEKLLSLKPSHQRGPYLAAFRQANSLLANSLGGTKRLVFLGDSQENQWTEHASSPAFLKGVTVDLPELTATAQPNLSLADPRVQRVFLGEKSLVNFTVRLAHAGPAKTATVVLRANGQVIFNKQLDLAKEAPTTLLHAQWDAPTSDWLRGEVSVAAEPDALPGDNRVFFSLAPLVEGRVAVLAQSTFLRIALSPDIMKGQWAARVVDPGQLAKELAGNEDADVLCLESGYLQSTDARKLVNRYLTNGRGVLLVVNRLTPTITGALRELGLEAEGFVRAADDRPEKLAFFAANHAVFHPFTAPDYGNLSEINIYRHARLKGPEAMPLVFSERGSSLFFQSGKFPGKLFVAAFGLDREHSSWPVHQTFIPFLDLTLQAARADDPTPLAYEPAQIALVHLPPRGDVQAEAATLLLQDEQQSTLGRLTSNQGRIQVPMPDRPGLYSLREDQSKSPLKVFSVNPPAKESDLAYLADPEPVRLWQLQGEAAHTHVTKPLQARASLSGILQQRAWWWMLLGGLFLLTVEMLWADWRRQPTTENRST